MVTRPEQGLSEVRRPQLPDLLSAGAPGLGSSFAVFPRVLKGCWIGSGAAKT